MNTNYAEAYKMAYDYDTMINVIHEHRKQKAMEQTKQKARKKKTDGKTCFLFGREPSKQKTDYRD